MKKLLSRREFARKCAIVLAAIPLSALSENRVPLIPKKHLPELDPASDQATALSYTHDVDAIPVEVLLSEHPYYEPESKCSNCIHFQGNSEWGKCNIFMNNVVNEKGWCSVWAKKPNFPLQLQPTGMPEEYLNMGP